MNRTNLFLIAATLFFSLTLSAQETTPEDQDPTLPNKTEVVCGASASFFSAQNGATRDSNLGNVFKVKAQPDSSDKRATTSGIVKLERGHEFAFSLTWIPRASNLVRGEDLMNATVRYQRRDSADKVKVLAESVIASDQITNFGELQARRIDLSLRASFINPEVSTLKANRANLPDGITTNGSFECTMRVGNSPDLR